MELMTQTNPFQALVQYMKSTNTSFVSGVCEYMATSFAGDVRFNYASVYRTSVLNAQSIIEEASGVNREMSRACMFCREAGAAV